MLRPHAWIVESRRDRMGFHDLAVVVLQQVGPIAMQHAGTSGRQRGRVPACGKTGTTRFAPDQAHVRVADVRVENPHRVGAAAHARENRIGLPADQLGQLGETFATNHGIEVAHHHRVRMRACYGTDDVKRVLDIGHPVAHRLVERVF